ncbi:hypothetical protein B0H13DRAFT_1854944 [Mycena leptocephala]|nr:hypothetical protein B0H13DRAFT_1854944 [Mycena leptocephala]
MGAGSTITVRPVLATLPPRLNDFRTRPKRSTFPSAPTFLDSVDGDCMKTETCLICGRLTCLSTTRGRACRPTVHKLFQQEDVVGLNGSVVLVGDAAHTVLIHGSHNSSMAIPVFTETYQELRQHRTNETRMSEYQSLVQITLPDGPLQEERDVTLRLTLDQGFLDFDNCKSLEPVWEQYLVLFNHDAGEVARDWWSKSDNNYHVQLFTH